MILSFRMPKIKVRPSYLVNTPGQRWAQDRITLRLAHVNDSTRLSVPSAVTKHWQNQARKRRDSSPGVRKQLSVHCGSLPLSDACRFSLPIWLVIADSNTSSHLRVTGWKDAEKLQCYSYLTDQGLQYWKYRLMAHFRREQQEKPDWKKNLINTEKCSWCKYWFELS